MPEADDLRGIRLSLYQGRAGRLKAQVERRSLEPDESMNSRVSWSLEDIDPSVRERAEAAARRAGMSLSDWLNSTIGDSAPPDFRSPPDQRFMAPSQETRDVADIHQRLDSITRQIEQISRPAPRNDAPRGEPVRGEPGVARQLNDAISRLDARLSQISNPQPARQAQLQDSQRKGEMVERAAAQVYRSSPPLSPASLDFAIAEIAARQSELDNSAPRPMPPRAAPPMAPAMPAGPDFSALERHLLKITSQIEALQRPDGIEQSIAGFRSELSEIRHAITEAMPRRAIESIESEIRSLSRRIDDTRQSGIDAQALAGIERALGEIREVLRSLTPAEQLAGYDEAIRNLGAKLDLILRSNDDPGTVQQLEGAIAALRAIVSNVASNDALARLSDDVHMLSSKVDQLTRSADNGDSFAILEQRIAALTSTLEHRERAVASESSEQIERALQALSDRLDRMPVGNDSASAFAHLEQRVSYLLERLEASADHRAGNLGRVEDGLQDILRHLEAQQANLAALAGSGRSAAEPADSAGNLGRVEDGLQDILRHLETQQANFAALAGSSRSAAEPADSGLIDIVKRELSDIRFNQSETDRHTQDSLETVHNTLGHVVDRLAMIEGDLRAVRVQPAAPLPEMPSAPQSAPPQADVSPVAVAPQPKPELPNPAAALEHFVAAPREFHAAQAPMPVVAPRAISEILEPYTAPPRVTIEPELPHDHPLEPGTRPTGRAASPSERIAASESAISEIPASPPGPVSTSNFIAAARRAAQAAAAAPPNDKATRSSPLKTAAGDRAGEPSTITSKIRSVLVGASVVVIVLGTFKMAMTLLDSGSPPPMPAMENSSEQAPSAQSPGADGAKPAMPDAATPSMTSPTPIGRQSFNSAAPGVSDSTVSVAIPQTSAMPPASPISSSDITGTIPAVQPAQTGHRLGLVQVPPTERLPDGIGGPVLRAAALKGDATAAYEIGLRFAEGKGVATNFDEAAKWYDRAAQAGVVPAIFRLGTLYEKGLSVTKDVDIARRYYLQAAERGNAKAMHNLAVLDADGGGKGANYKNASQWFRKAADRGVADSQYNLGILYARGIGVEQNLAESFKWFSLAAAQGDADSARKRDDIAKRLDAQSLAAAKLAIQTFTPEPQPDDAINAASPAGGWDSAPAQAAAPKPAAKPVSTKRAAR
jgi:localization factor PodJL